MEQLQEQCKSCPRCGAQMPENAAFCPGCGCAMPAVTEQKGNAGALSGNVTAALAYFTFLPAIVLLLLPAYRKNPFVRFHALQCLLSWGAAIVLGLVLKYVGLLLFLIPIVGPLLVLLVDVTAGLAAIFIWVVLVIKALQGEAFPLPWLGEIAERYSRQA